MVDDGVGTNGNPRGVAAGFLAAVAQAVASSHDRMELLQHLYREVNGCAPSDVLAVSWAERGHGSLLSVLSPASAILQDRLQLASPMREMRQMSPRAGDLPLPSHRELAFRWLRSRGFQSLLSVPLSAAGEHVGELVVGRHGSRGYSRDDSSHLLLMAGLVGAALHGMACREELAVAGAELKRNREQMEHLERRLAHGELTAGVAHDLNNILGLIAARLDLLRHQGLPNSALASLASINQAIDDGITVARRMTQFARGQRHEEFSLVSLNRLVEEAVEMTRPRWHQDSSSEAPVEMKVKLGPMSLVMGSAPELREVLVNLVVNALDAMPAGGRLEIATRREGPWAVVSISDTGVGMPEEVRRRVFEPFFTTKGKAGSGLGLWVSSGLVVHHGGDIQVESESGKGSVFKIRLPSLAGVTEYDTSPLGRRSHRILLACSDASKGETLRMSLEVAGYQVVSLGCPDACLDALRSESFNLVIVESCVLSPVGLELVSRSKEISPRTPVIAILDSSDEFPQDERQLGESVHVVDAVIRKPYGINELRTKLANLLADAPPVVESQRSSTPPNR